MADLTADEFSVLSELVLRESAIVLEPGKEYLIETRLAPILRREGIPTYADFIAELRRPQGRRYLDMLVDAMTTNETSFFRDVHPWETLRTDLLPRLIAARANVRRLTIWCAAASSGQEPYTIAMIIHEHFPEVARDWTVRIIGTDLSPSMITKSSAGRYTQLEINRGLPAMMMMKYFTRAGTEWEVNPDIRRMCDFRVGNLVEDSLWAQVPLVDAVFIRNVLIYFSKQTREQILTRVHGRLRSDGFLMLGSSETALGAEGYYEREQIGKTITFNPTAGASERTLVGAGR